ncbi:MAG TPA: hypothetical protein PL151_13835 [Phycisphaerae bacterium]|nr:hypothetical protein [Phycisphaerae bacterium]HQA00141.1 hypothetical protein [Phycisphaerae bacterium]HQE28836.1 hypothetical protein [Phycisphaerae bacterium]
MSSGQPMYVMDHGRAAYVLVPIDEYEELVKASMIKSATDKLRTTSEDAWVDADVFRR